MGRPVGNGPLVWKHRTGELRLDRTHVMGVLNVTPDSFSDGGRHFEPAAAIRRALQMADEGADLLDVGGESTRPRSDPVLAHEEWRRVGPVLEAVTRKLDVPISIDTRKPEIAEKALQAGASIVNDVTGLRDPRMVGIIAQAGAGAVIMHMRGDPKTMQDDPRYEDVVRQVRDFLDERVRSASANGVAREAVAVDPGIGFGKSVAHNLSLLRGLGTIAAIGVPIVVGVSRKSFIGALGGAEAGERLPGSLAAATLAVAHGAHVVRAHDVAETVRAMRVADAVLRGRENL